jgi:hypothetical protein
MFTRKYSIPMGIKVEPMKYLKTMSVTRFALISPTNTTAFLQHVFKITAWKMAMTTPQLILRVHKPVEVLI